MDNLTREQLLALVEVSDDLTHMLNTPINDQLADVLKNSHVLKSPNDYYYYDNVDFILLHKSLIFNKCKVIIVYGEDNACMKILASIENYSYEDIGKMVDLYKMFIDSMQSRPYFPFINKEYLIVVNSKFVTFCQTMAGIHNILNA